MKNKIFIGTFLVVFVLLLNFIYFVTTYGMYSNDQPSLGERISLAFSHPLWLSPLYTIIVSVSNPILTLFLVVLGVILYYLYDNFVRDKKDIQTDASIESAGVIENKNQTYDENSKIEFYNNNLLQIKSGNRVFKKVVLWGSLAIAIWVAFVFSISSGPGEGMVGLMFLLPVMPIIYIFYPVYFVILSVRYSKEKSGMDPLDKIMFYILMAAIVPFGAFAVYKVSSGNIIKNLLVDRKQDIEKRSIQIDLVAKDISFDRTGNIKVNFCNDSSNSPNFYTKHFSIKVETDKKAEFAFEPIIFPPESGKCDERAVILNQLGLNEGDVADITVLIDPENKVNETNKENNKMTKNIIFGKKQGECFDTDGGKNYYEKGVTTLQTTGAGVIDNCKKALSDKATSPQGQYLIESYCENGKVLNESYECPNGCSDGACIK